MKTWFRTATLIALGAFASLGFGQSWTFVKINPKATYLRDSQATAAATWLHVGFEHKSDFSIELRTIGWFNRAADNKASQNVSNEAVAVFAESNEIDGNWTNRHRVIGAHDAGADFFTLPTWHGGHDTDIEEDFGVGAESIVLEIPDGANYLLFTPYDNGFWNNEDEFNVPGADPRGFGIEYRLIRSSVPEPGTLAILSLGVAAGYFRRRKASR